MALKIAVVNVDTQRDVTRDLVDALRRTAGEDGPHYLTLEDLARDTITADAGALSIAFLFRRKDEYGYAAKEACRALTRRCRELSQYIDGVRNVIIVDCATKAESAISDFAILGEYLRIISAEISPDADADVLCLDYEYDTTGAEGKTVRIDGVASIRDEAFVERCMSYCSKAADGPNEMPVFR